MKGDVEITHTVRQIPRALRDLPYMAMKRAVLGVRYELSLVFVGNALSRRLNRERRGKDKSANVLSFSLSPNFGEIFIDVAESRRQAPRFGLTHPEFVSKLFIHGLLHLKGMQHGDTMERAETRFFKKFGLTTSLSNGSSNSSRHRHRNIPSQGGHR